MALPWRILTRRLAQRAAQSAFVPQNTQLTIRGALRLVASWVMSSHAVHCLSLFFFLLPILRYYASLLAVWYNDFSVRPEKAAAYTRGVYYNGIVEIIM